MKKLTNSCCLHHVSGGNSGYDYDPNCPGCNGEWEREDQEKARISRESFSNWISFVGGNAVGAIASASGIGAVASRGISVAAAVALKPVGNYMYDNPEAWRHPDYE
ncbi:hypothetical protein [Ursidibacter sp. B-7004-1]